MPNTKFDSKSFNPQAFGYMVGRVPDLKRNEIRKSRALTPDPYIKQIFASQNGTEYARIAMRGLIGGEADNYDGNTDISVDSTKTFERGVIVVGRQKGWSEKDFSYDITGGVDFMENIAQQVSKYKESVDQKTLLAILSGIFAMNGDAKSAEFVAKHTYDITGASTDEGKRMGAATLNSAIGRACGDNKEKISMVFMHSDVATNLENLNLLQHLKQTDKDGVTRDLALGTWNGRLVVIDDGMPLTQVTTTAETKGVYTITIGTKGIAGDKLTIGGVEYTFATSTSAEDHTIAVGSSSTTQAGQLKTLLEAQYAGVFSVTNSTNTVVLTQILGGTGAAPSISATQTTDGTIAASIATTTPGVAEVTNTTYVTYALGEGAFSYVDVGAKVPYEMDRDPKTKGGEDYLFMRQRKVFAPYGISYEKASQSSDSPTNSELSSGANWALVHSGEASADARTYIDHKSIPIVRILSLG